MAETCATCKFYLPSVIEQALQKYGQCRRYPPTALTEKEIVWITTTFWCGEYVARPAPDAGE